MKILWFTNTACSASEILFPNHNRGGWLSSLEKELSLHDEIELHIAFYHSEKLEQFTYNKTVFHPIFRSNSNSKFLRYVLRVLHKESDDIKDVLALVDIVNNVKPDLIHVHGTEENFGLVQSKVTIPVIISIQGVLNSIVEKFYAGIPNSVSIKHEKIKNKILLKSSTYSYNLLYRKATREREMLKSIKYIIGRTEFDKRVSKLFSPNCNYYIGHEILRQAFYLESWGKDTFEPKIQILSIISNDTFKGFETILKTALNLKRFNIDFEWKVAGINQNNSTVSLVLNWLRIRVHELNVQLLGSLDEMQLINLFKSTDIFCQVSHIENSPNTLCEALIMGVPTIATFAGGTSTLLENNKEGILVQDGDSYSMAGAIIEMCNDFEKAKQFSVNARQNALVRHNKVKIVEQTIFTYNKILEINR